MNSKFTFLYLIFCQNLFAVDIIGLKLIDRLESKKNSPYQVLISKFNQQYSDNSSLRVQPLKRAMHSFLAGKSDCITPSSIRVINIFASKKNARIDLIQSTPIELVAGRVFSRKSERALESKEELENKTIASWRGISAALLFPGIKFKLYETLDDVQSLSLLYASRVDYIVGFEPDTPLVAENKGFPMPNFDPNYFVLKSKVKIVCHNNVDTQKFIKSFNRFLNKMKLNGQLKEILGRYSKIVG